MLHMGGRVDCGFGAAFSAGGVLAAIVGITQRPARQPDVIRAPVPFTYADAAAD
jgi:hypothetical protein